MMLKNQFSSVISNFGFNVWFYVVLSRIVRDSISIIALFLFILYMKNKLKCIPVFLLLFIFSPILQKHRKSLLNSAGDLAKKLANPVASSHLRTISKAMLIMGSAPIRDQNIH
jgi:hypothetical protein